MTGCTLTDRLLEILGRARFQLDDEKRLQGRIEEILQNAGIDHLREYRLSNIDIIDFLCGRVGIEVKIKGGKRAILRQLQRYAASDRIDALILLSAVATGLPASINGKPVFRLSLGRAWM